MGQKVNPIGFRLAGVKTWASQWFSKKNYSQLLHEDLKARVFLKKFYHAGISSIGIERAADKAKINIFAARPGVIIGKKGVEIEKLKKELENMITGEAIINILEVRKPEVDAQLTAENVALQLERRVSFRRAMKKSVTSALKFGQRVYASPAPEDWGEQKWPEWSGIGKDAFLSILYGQILIMVLQKRRLLTD